MLLTVKERLMIQKMLPDEANFLTLKLVNKARNDLSFTDEEHTKLQFNQSAEGLLTWKDETVVADIEFGEVVTNLLVSALKKMDEENKLTVEHLSLYEKFIENK